MDLFYRIRGEGKPVLVLHGLFGSNDNQGGIARALAPDYKVYGLDLRNHGKSPHTDVMGYDLMAQDVLRMMDKEGIDQAYFVGHSMGGKTSMQLALNYPDRVGKLCVLDIAPVAYDHHHTAIMQGMRAASNEKPSTRKGVIEVLSQYESEPTIQSFLATNWRRDKDGQFDLRLNLDVLEQDYHKIIAGNTGGPYLGETLFIRGSNSNYITSAYKDQILNLFPKATVRTVEGAGHWLHAEKPDMVQRIVKRFLDQ